MRRHAPPQKFASPPLSSRTRAGDAFIANVRAAVAQIQANCPGASAGRDPEYLHQLRVGLRRLRSTLRAYRALLRRKEAVHLDRRLRTALRAFGAARDWDVFERTLSSPALLRRARAGATAARRNARATVRSSRFRFLAVELLAWAHGRPWRAGSQAGEPMGDFARESLTRAHNQLLDSAQRIDWRDAPRRHRARIRVKRLRYGCECFAAAWPGDAMHPFLKHLRHLQEILGELNDIDVQRRLLRQIAAAGAPARAVMTVSKSLKRREHRRFAKLRRAWDEFSAVTPYWRAAATASVPG